MDFHFFLAERARTKALSENQHGPQNPSLSNPQHQQDGWIDAPPLASIKPEYVGFYSKPPSAPSGGFFRPEELNGRFLPVIPAGGHFVQQSEARTRHRETGRTSETRKSDKFLPLQ